MRRRLSAAAILASLLTVYLGLPCLALAQAHSGMTQDHGTMAGEAASGPCETSDEPAAELLCAAPSGYAPLAAGLPDVPTGSLATVPLPPALDIGPGQAPAPRDTTLPGVDPPAFLLHRTLLI